MISKVYKVGKLRRYKYVVVLSRYNGKLLLSRHKRHITWETQGGHIEEGETPMEAAKRELYEESGAIGYGIVPLCDYWAGDLLANLGANGMVFVADIYELGDIPESEMAEVKTFDQLPDVACLTYPGITPQLFHTMNQKKIHQCNELMIDLHNYIPDGSVFKRTAVRGIIKRDCKYLLIHSKYGDHKFPGGGRKKGETLEQTLIREVQEETGFHVKVDSISEAFMIDEKRKGDPDDLMIMRSFYYICDVADEAGTRNLDDYEAEYDYQICWMTMEEAIANNEATTEREKIPWIQRETMAMKKILDMKL